MKKLLYCLIVILLTGCIHTPSRLRGEDIRLWKNTPAWELAKAVRNRDTIQIKKILSKDKISIDYREPTYGQSLLHWAVWHNEASMIEFLLKQGADINLRDYWSSDSPLILACRYSEIDAKIVRILLDNGASPNDLPSEYDSVYEGRMRTNYTPLLEAAHSSLEKTKMLIEAGADPYYCCKPGNNALNEASHHFEIAEYLLIECNIDPNQSYTVTIHGDTLRFRDLLALFPEHRISDEMQVYLERIYQYLDECEKNHTNK